jgi:hypothetical protein
VPIPLIVNLSTSYEVIPIDLVNVNADKELIDSLTKILEILKDITFARSRYEGGMVNEVGRRIEKGLVNEMDKYPLRVRQLPKSGYPDIEIDYNGFIIYLEMKTSLLSRKILDLNFSII